MLLEAKEGIRKKNQTNGSVRAEGLGLKLLTPGMEKGHKQRNGILEAGKDKELDSLLDPPERNAPNRQLDLSALKSVSDF